MKKQSDKTQYFFVDEAGDPVFYNQYGKYIVGEEGCSKILLVGFIKTNDPDAIRTSVLKLQKEISEDPYLKDIPSIEKTKKSFHAKDDAPEVREKFYKMILDLDFSVEIFVARKKEAIFKKRHSGKQNLFYDDLVIQLFKNKLHLATKSVIYFAVRGNRERQAPLQDAIQTAKNTFEEQHDVAINSEIEILPQSPSGEPCLSVVDYVNWAVQRAFVKGEMRYYKFIESKVKFIVDIYDSDKYPNNYYSKNNTFDINKISPL
jgi:hypothetical protein